MANMRHLAKFHDDRSNGCRDMIIFQIRWLPAVYLVFFVNKSSAVAEMGDRGHNKHGPKRWGLLCPFRAELHGTPSNTMWPGPRSTSVPCGVFVHPAVWP